MTKTNTKPALCLSGTLTVSNGIAQISITGDGDRAHVKFTEPRRVHRFTVAKPNQLSSILLMFAYHDYANIAGQCKRYRGKFQDIQTADHMVDSGVYTHDLNFVFTAYGYSLAITEDYISLMQDNRPIASVTRSLSNGALLRYLLLFTLGQFDQIAWGLSCNELTPLTV